jgi:hypothetical protein
MPIFRGTGGSTSTTDQATIDQVTEDAATATIKAAEAASSASNAASSATSAATSASNAATQATNASNSATTASTQATNSATSATAAAASASSANTSAGIASDSIEFAEEWATKAEDSLISTDAGGDGSTDYSSLHHAAKSAASATSAASSASTATTKASEASTSASNAASSASAASGSASAASSSATAAATSATASAGSATSAASSATAAQAALDSIENFYLGASATAPTVDDNGDPLAAGDWYFNTTDNLTYIYNGSSWQVTVTDTSGLVATSGGSMTGNLSFGDNVYARFGDSDDLQIYHSGTYSLIEEQGTGSLFIYGTDLRLGSTAGEDYIKCEADDAVSLYYDNAPKLATTSTGIDVTGTVTADGFINNNKSEFFGSENGLVSTGSTAKVYATGSGFDGVNGSLVLQSRPTSGADVYIATGSTPKTVAKFDDGGDISFYEDTGTTPKFFWDASTESLGIGTTAASYALRVVPNVANHASTGAIQIQAAINGSGKGLVIDSNTRTTNDNSVALLETISRNNTTGLKVQVDGNVGIGTSSPKSELNIAANNSGQGAKLTLENTDLSITNGDTVGQIDFYANDTSINGIGAKASIEAIVESVAGTLIGIRFGTSDGDSATAVERMRIDSSGRVGIGTSSPSEKLDVAGTIKAKRGYGATETASKTGSVTPDMDTYQNFVWTLTGNVTLSNPSDEAVGQSGFFVFIQDGTGSRTVSLGTDYETAGGAGLTLSSTASATDVVPYIVAASGRIILGAPQLAFS